MKPDCVLLTCRMFWKCLFSTSSMAWQNPQMKNREATMRKANNRVWLFLVGCMIFNSHIYMQSAPACKLESTARGNWQRACMKGFPFINTPSLAGWTWAPESLQTTSVVSSSS